MKINVREIRNTAHRALMLLLTAAAVMVFIILPLFYGIVSYQQELHDLEANPRRELLYTFSNGCKQYRITAAGVNQSGHLVKTRFISTECK